MKKNLFIIFIFSKVLVSQNLVPNWSFETYTACPNSSSQLPFASPWFAPTTNSTDYYNACAPAGNYGVPNFGPGPRYNLPAKNGNAYTAFYFKNGGFGTNYREYAQVQLIDSLINGKCYYVEFYASLCCISQYGVNNVAANFSKNAYPTTSGTLWGKPMHITQFGNPIIKDTTGWIKVSGIYPASGGEQFICIGNFRDDTLTSTVLNPFGVSCGCAYYFIDAVSVYSVNPTGVLPWKYRDTTVAVGDSVYIGNSMGGTFTSNWYTYSGSFIKTGPGIYVKPVTTSTYVVQFTVCGVPRSDTLKVSVTGVGVHELGVESSELVVSPNPSNGQFTLEITNPEFRIRDEELRILNMLGLEIKREKLQSKKQKINLEDLEAGIYYLQLIQGKNVSSVKKIVKQ